jgi:hypothetical protein
MSDLFGLDSLGVETPPALEVEEEPDFFALSLAPRADITDVPAGSDPWPPSFPLDIALGAEDEDKILLRHGVSQARYEDLKVMPVFRRALAEAQKEIADKGYSFKVKCRHMAEDFLAQLYKDFFGDRATLAQRHEVFKTTARLGELEPKDVKDGPAGGVPQVNIQINL